MATRDYKSAPRNPPAARRSGSPLLIGLVIGLLVGLGIALAVAIYLFKVPDPFLPRDPAHTEKSPAVSKADAPKPDAARPEPARPKAATPAPEAPAMPSPGGTGAADKDKPRFDFYKILPGTEEGGKGKEGKEAKPAEVVQAPEPAATGVVYYMQAGAFQNAADADNLKARLALAGIEAGIQTGERADGKVWHRVRVGPFRTVEEAGHARDRLKQQQIEGTLVKLQEKAAQ